MELEQDLRRRRTRCCVRSINWRNSSSRSASRRPDAAFRAPGDGDEKLAPCFRGRRTPSRCSPSGVGRQSARIELARSPRSRHARLSDILTEWRDAERRLAAST